MYRAKQKSKYLKKYTHVRTVRIVQQLRARMRIGRVHHRKRTQHRMWHIAVRGESTAQGGREAITKKRKRHQRYTLRYFLNSPSQAVYIPRWLCILQSYALRRESHPSGFFARRISLNVISQTTGSPREMAVSVVRYLALLMFCALLQYR